MTSLAELRALLTNVHNRPWRAVRDGDEFYTLFDEDDEYVLMHSDVHDAKENAELIAAAVNALPALLDVAEAAQEWRTAAGLFDPRSPEVRARAAKLAEAIDRMTRTDGIKDV